MRKTYTWQDGKTQLLKSDYQTKRMRWLRQFAIIPVCILLVNCSSLNPWDDDEEEGVQGQIGSVAGFLGGVAADEPQAVSVGRDILSAGGSAADAMIGMYYTLAATLPSSASLGSGGTCLVRDAEKNETTTLDFLSRPPIDKDGKPSRVVSIPGSPRGMIALYSRHGKLKWSMLVAPAENFARFGTRVSRSLANDIRAAQTIILSEPALKAIFTRPDGKLMQEGDKLTQSDLSTILSRIRSRGPGDLYNGTHAQEFTASVQVVGGQYKYEELRAYLPIWRPSIEVPYAGNLQFQFTTPPGPAGMLGSQMMAMLGEGDRFEDTFEEERPHLIAEVAERAFGEMRHWLDQNGGSRVSLEQHLSPETISKLMGGYKSRGAISTDGLGGTGRMSDQTGTGLVSFDRFGNSVACSITMNGLFGSGRVARGTGIILGKTAEPGNSGLGSVSTMMMVNKSSNKFYYASAASGGWPAVTALAQTAAYAVMGTEDDLTTALARPRVHPGGWLGLTYVEKGAKNLKSFGHNIKPINSLGRVHAVFCKSGIPAKKDISCSIKTDQRGTGLAFGGE